MYFAYFILVLLGIWFCIGIYLFIDIIFLQPKNEKKNLQNLQSQLDSIRMQPLSTKPKFWTPTIVPFVAPLFYVR